MTSLSVVRPAVPADKPELWRLFRLLHAENAMLPISDRKVNFHIDRFLCPSSIAKDDAGPRGFIGVIGKPSGLEGAIMMSLGQTWYSEQWTLDEYLNFVDPAHRASHHSKELIRYAKGIIDRMLPTDPTMRLIIGVLSVKKTTVKIRHYAQTFGPPIGAFFTYPPIPGFEGLPVAYCDEVVRKLDQKLHVNKGRRAYGR